MHIRVKEATPQEKRSAQLAALIYFSATAFYGLIILVYLLHKKYPVLLDYFLTSRNGVVEINLYRYMALIIGLPLLIPVVAIPIHKFKSPGLVVAGVLIISFILGTTAAILCINSESDFILIPIGVVGATFFVSGIGFLIDASHTFSKWLHVWMLAEAGSFAISVNSYYLVEWYAWVICFAILFILMYLTFTPRDLINLTPQTEYNAEVARRDYFQGIHFISYLSLAMFYPHILGMYGVDVVQRNRRWMGPEDGR